MIAIETPRPVASSCARSTSIARRGGLQLEVRIVVLRRLRIEQVHALREIDARIAIQRRDDVRDVAPLGYRRAPRNRRRAIGSASLRRGASRARARAASARGRRTARARSGAADSADSARPSGLRQASPVAAPSPRSAARRRLLGAAADCGPCRELAQAASSAARRRRARSSHGGSVRQRTVLRSGRADRRQSARATRSSSRARRCDPRRGARCSGRAGSGPPRSRRRCRRELLHLGGRGSRRQTRCRAARRRSPAPSRASSNCCASSCGNGVNHSRTASTATPAAAATANGAAEA